MMRTLRIHVAVMGICAILGAAGCGESDPRARVLEERERWQVDLASWATGDDGSIRITLQVSGPVQSFLETLSVRLQFIDAAENPYHTHWEVLDLSRVQRGTPTEFRIILDALEQAPEGIAVSMVPRPGPEDEPHIAELAGALAGG
jgi:hypothetical protein